MEDFKNKFKSNEWNMITYLLVEGKGDKSWEMLAQMFILKPNGTADQRKKTANDVWRRFNRLVNNSTTDLVTIKQTLNGNGEVLFETKKVQPKEQTYQTEGMVIKKVTTNPHGGEWITYETVRDEVKEETILNAVQRLIDTHLGFKNEDLTKVDLECQDITTEQETWFSQGGDRLAIVNLYDAHLDKIPVKSSCGVESTVEQNIEIFLKTIDRICLEIRKHQVTEIIFPVGNDLFHTNGFNSQTKKGTQIEYYGSPEDNYYAIADAITEAVLKLAVVAKKGVKVIMVKGNHDEDKIAVLGYWLDRIFQGTNVTVDYLRKQRKYIKFGQNLIGFAHGDKEKSKIAQLPLIMATEAKEFWGNTTHRKMYLGDLHHGFEYQFLKAKDQPGVEVEYLRSVGTTDSWHEDFGWIGIAKTAYLQIFDAEEGEVIRQKFNIK